MPRLHPEKASGDTQIPLLWVPADQSGANLFPGEVGSGSVRGNEWVVDLYPLPSGSRQGSDFPSRQWQWGPVGSWDMMRRCKAGLIFTIPSVSKVQQGVKTTPPLVSMRLNKGMNQGWSCQHSTFTPPRVLLRPNRALNLCPHLHAVDWMRLREAGLVSTLAPCPAPSASESQGFPVGSSRSLWGAEPMHNSASRRLKETVHTKWGNQYPQPTLYRAEDLRLKSWWTAELVDVNGFGFVPITLGVAYQTAMDNWNRTWVLAERCCYN